MLALVLKPSFSLNISGSYTCTREPEQPQGLGSGVDSAHEEPGLCDFKPGNAPL